MGHSHQREAHADTRCRPVDRSDDWHGEIAPLQQDRMVGIAQPVPGPLCPLDKIGAGAEAAARAGDQEAPHVRAAGSNHRDRTLDIERYVVEFHDDPCTHARSAIYHG